MTEQPEGTQPPQQTAPDEQAVTAGDVGTVPTADPGPDADGYEIVEQAPPEGGQVTYQVIREADGVGLGAYSTADEIARAIANDREYLARRAREEAETAAKTETPEQPTT